MQQVLCLLLAQTTLYKVNKINEFHKQFRNVSCQSSHHNCGIIQACSIKMIESNKIILKYKCAECPKRFQIMQTRQELVLYKMKNQSNTKNHPDHIKYSAPSRACATPEAMSTTASPQIQRCQCIHHRKL